MQAFLGLPWACTQLCTYAWPSRAPGICQGFIMPSADVSLPRSLTFLASNSSFLPQLIPLPQESVKLIVDDCFLTYAFRTGIFFFHPILRSNRDQLWWRLFQRAPRQVKKGHSVGLLEGLQTQPGPLGPELQLSRPQWCRAPVSQAHHLACEGVVDAEQVKALGSSMLLPWFQHFFLNKQTFLGLLQVFVNFESSEKLVLTNFPTVFNCFYKDFQRSLLYGCRNPPIFLNHVPYTVDINFSSLSLFFYCF